MKVISKANIKLEEFATCDRKVLVNAGKECDQRDLPCNKRAR